jgi:hypothetical protein
MSDNDKLKEHSDLLKRARNHLAMMAPHQKERQQGKLLIELVSALTDYEKAQRSEQHSESNFEAAQGCVTGNDWPEKRSEQPQELERFNRKWKQVENGCWIWIDRKEGYGAFIFNGRKEQAHRVSWLLHHGEIPEGLCVLHDCDTPNCVNPNHLHLGTVKDNAIEAVERGLWGDKAGESNGNSRLTKNQIREIRESADSYRAIAIRFGIGKSQVGNIKKGLQWTKL